MVISDKQQQANQQNSQKSTGPTTPQGKQAIRFNALTYGLRTLETLLPRENAAEYSRLWDELEADWQPKTRTERCYLETMVTSQWLLRRIAEGERQIYTIADLEHRFKMLAYVYKQRAQLERSFRTAVADMKQSQKDRQPRQPQPPQKEQPAKPAQPVSTPASKPTPPQTPSPDYVMSGFSEPAATDSR
jgi:hypothetical protein